MDTRIGLPADEPCPYNLHFGQQILAQLVMRHLQRLPNAQVLFNHRVVGLAQDSSGVTLAVETPNGREEMRSNWLLAPMAPAGDAAHLVKRRDDVAMMRRMVEDPKRAPSATLLAEQLFGHPMPV